MKRSIAAFAILFAVTSITTAHSASKLWDESTNEQERSRLYTKTDPTATGGIRGIVGSLKDPIRQALAICQDEPGKVYKGSILGENNREFRFNGLPPDKYDLVLIYKKGFYEGLRLNRRESTLTKKDKEKISYSIKRSEPFFTVKTIHRVGGKTGRGEFARAICTYIRDKRSLIYAGPIDDYKRTFKLVMLKDVGPGWQIVRARDLYPLYVIPAESPATHHFSKSLQRIRVTNKIKDLGELTL